MIDNSGQFSIVKCTTADIFKLAKVSKEWLSETKAPFPINTKQATDQIMSWLRDPNYAIFALDTLDDPFYVGWIIGYLHDYPFFNGQVVSEVAWYVRKEYRGCGSILVGALERWGNDMGAKIFISHILLGAGADNGEKACRSLTNAGFQEFERTFYRLIS